MEGEATKKLWVKGKQGKTYTLSKTYILQLIKTKLLLKPNEKENKKRIKKSKQLMYK